MADYYSLLARAVSAIPQSTPQMRQAVYERARAALFNQLRAIQPPVAESVIETEGRALDEAIGRLEAEAAAKAGAPTSAPQNVETQIGYAGPEHGAPTPAAAEPVAMADEPPVAEQPPFEPQRPAAPLPPLPERDSGSRRILGILAILIVLAVVVGFAAFYFRERPQDLAKLKPEDQTSESDEGGKIADRVDGDGERAAPGGNGATRMSKTGDGAVLPVAQKAELLVASAQDPNKVDKVYPGSVVWRLDSVNGAAGEPVSSAIRGDADVPDAKMKLGIVIQKNLDATLSASHTIKISFSFAPDSPVKGVRAIGAIQMRRPDARSGEKIVGVPVPITENNFLIGLLRSDKDQRNVASLRTLGILDLPMQFADGRAATISLEKGASGDEAFTEAIESWGK